MNLTIDLNSCGSIDAYDRDHPYHDQSEMFLNNTLAPNVTAEIAISIPGV